MKVSSEPLIEGEISVFGSSGFIGSHFVQKSQFSTIAIPRNQRYPVSDQILYLIGTNNNYNIFKDIYLDIDTNLKILIETLEQTRQKRPMAIFNFVSSWFVYGLTDIPFTEDQCCKPNGTYSITKYAGELLLRSFCETFSMKYRIIRLGNIIGPGDKNASSKKNAIQHMANLVLSGHDINLYEGGEVVRDLLHIDDAVRGLDLIMEKGALNEVYNLSSGVGVKIGDLMRRFKKLVGSNSNINSIKTPDFHSHIQARDSVLDISKITSLGFSVSKPVTEKDLLDK